MTYREYCEEKDSIVKQAMAQARKGNMRALNIAHQRLIGLKDHFKVTKGK